MVSISERKLLKDIIIEESIVCSISNSPDFAEIAIQCSGLTAKTGAGVA